MDYSVLKKARRYARQQLNKILENHYGHISHAAAKALELAEEKYNLGTMGVEGFTGTNNRGDIRNVLYLNAGDTYETTLLFIDDDCTGYFTIGNWGDIVERGRY